MNFEEVYNDLKRKRRCLTALFSNFDERFLKKFQFFHVVIHKSALLKFDRNLSNIKISQLWRNEHVHLIVHSINGIRNSEGIRSQRIELSKLDYIDKHFISCSEKEHEFSCNVTFGISLLKNMCIESILKNLDYLHNMEKLKLPKHLLMDIFQKSKSDFHLPEFDGQSPSVKTIGRTILERFTQQDMIFHKKFVVWFQNEICFKMSYCSLRTVIVFFYFTTADNDSVKMCLKCMKFEHGNGYYQRRYVLVQRHFISNTKLFVQDLGNWCNVCRQVPLFQILTRTQYDNLYKYDIFENDTDYMSYDKLLIKTDYFENDEKIQSRYVLSKTAFGGTNHPYIK